MGTKSTAVANMVMVADAMVPVVTVAVVDTATPVTNIQRTILLRTLATIDDPGSVNQLIIVDLEGDHGTCTQF